LSHFAAFSPSLRYLLPWVIQMKPLKKKVSLTLDSDLLQHLKELSEKSDRSLSQYINLVLKKYVGQKIKPEV